MEEIHESAQIHRTPGKSAKYTSPQSANNNKHYFKISCPSLNEIKQSMEPQKNNVQDLMNDLNQSIDDMFHTVDGYSSKLQGMPSTKHNIMHILHNQYSFYTLKQLPPGTISKQTKNPAAYLHEGRLYRPRQDQIKGQTKLEIMSKALSEQKISKVQRKIGCIQFNFNFILAQDEDIKKKQEVIRQIQYKIDTQEQVIKENEEAMKKKEQERKQMDQNIGSLTLNMISDIRSKYFEQLVSKDSEEKYHRIKDIRDILIPQQLSNVKKNFAAMQKEQLKSELLSKKSTFNSYYQLLALEKSLKRVVNLKLKGDITQFSRFQNAAKDPNYNTVVSPVKRYIHISNSMKVQELQK